MSDILDATPILLGPKQPQAMEQHHKPLLVEEALLEVEVP
jgi:hypothetical protein